MYSDFGIGVDVVVTESRTVPLSATDSVVIFLTQIDGGIRFGVSHFKSMMAIIAFL